MPVYKNKDNDSYYIKTYVKDEFGNSKQITRRNKEWVGRKGKELAQQEEIRIRTSSRMKNCGVVKKMQKYVSFEELEIKYLEEIGKRNKESTRYTYEQDIKKNMTPFFKKKNMVKITKNDIIEWHNYLNKKEHSIVYDKKLHSILESIIQMGVNDDNLEIYYNCVKDIENFTKSGIDKEKIKNKEKLRYITFEQFQKFISYVHTPIWKVYFNILFFTGMRRGEVQALTWEDIDLKNKKINVNKTLTVKTKNSPWKITSTKTQENRIIEIDGNLARLLDTYLKEKQLEKNFNMTDFVLGNNKKEPLKNHRIDHNKKKYFELSGIPEITNHEFRHSHVSLMINEYVKSGETDTSKFFLIMSNRMGHTIQVMQETYMHLFPDIQSPIVSLIESLNLKQGQK